MNLSCYEKEQDELLLRARVAGVTQDAAKVWQEINAIHGDSHGLLSDDERNLLDCAAFLANGVVFEMRRILEPNPFPATAEGGEK